MSRDYFVTNILIPLEQAIFLRGRAVHQKWFMVHLDNCSVHISPGSTDCLKEYGMRRTAHQLYSSDSASGDFYLFPTLKEKLERIQMYHEHQFFDPCKRC
jgi:hypothetical protein